MSSPKRILIDLQHPAHLHFFRHAARLLLENGHEVLFTGRDKDILKELARELDIRVVFFGKAGRGVIRLGLELIFRYFHLMKIIRRFRPNIIMAIAGTFVSLPGWLHRIPVHVFYDTEHAHVSNFLAYSFSECVHVPQCYRRQISVRHVRYNGYHELAYLHPLYFCPDPSVLSEAGILAGEDFALLRFVNWEAGHDIGLKGFSREWKIRAVQRLMQVGRVLISSEGELPSELELYRLKLPVSRIHHLMAFASLIFGESATMASEGAVLGVPGVFLDPVGRGYTDELERCYQIVFNFTPDNQEAAVEKGVALMRDCRTHPGKWRARGRRIIEEKINVTAMIIAVAEDRHTGRVGELT